MIEIRNQETKRELVVETKAITVAVTDDNIREGKLSLRFKNLSLIYSCPVTLALKLWIKRPFYVDTREICLTLGPLLERVPLPEEAQQFIRVFDDTGRGEPFSFEVPLSTWTLK